MTCPLCSGKRRDCPICLGNHLGPRVEPRRWLWLLGWPLFVAVMVAIAVFENVMGVAR